MSNKICYTAVIGPDYELNEVQKQNGWDYLCFTDQDIKSGTWNIVKPALGINRKTCREIKLRPGVYLSEHDCSLWLDSSIIIDCNINKFLGSNYCLMEHPERADIWEEAEKCIELKKDSEEVIREQVESYRNELGYFKVLVATGVLFRKNTPENTKFNELWWDEVQKYSIRDQLSFPYVAEKTHFTYRTIRWLDGFIWNRLPQI